MVTQTVEAKFEPFCRQAVCTIPGVQVIFKPSKAVQSSINVNVLLLIVSETTSWESDSITELSTQPLSDSTYTRDTDIQI